MGIKVNLGSESVEVTDFNISYIVKYD